MNEKIDKHVARHEQMVQKERDIDLEFKLLLGKPIPINRLVDENLYNIANLYPLTINQIYEIGLNNYYMVVNILLQHIDNIKNMIKVKNEKDIKNNRNLSIEEKEEINVANLCKSTLDYIIKTCFKNPPIRDIIIDFLSRLFHEPVVLQRTGCFCLGKNGERIITNRDYEEIKRVIKLQNCIKDQKKKSDKVIKFEARLAEMRKKYNKENNNTIIEVISSISAKSNSINLLNICELTIYQLYDQLTRLNMIEGYEFNFESLLNGAKKEDIGETKHWSTRIDN